MIVSDVGDETLKEMDLLVEEGVTSFKQFMAYPASSTPTTARSCAPCSAPPRTAD